MKKLLSVVLLSCGVLAAQGTFPTPGVWTKLASTAGYQPKTIGQFDSAASINGLYVAWEEYQTATFSELNDYNGAFSYADNRWEYLVQSSSWPSTHRSTPAHQWGYQFANPNTNMVYWIANSTQGITLDLYLYGCDMLSWGNCYDIPTFLEGANLTRPFESGGQTPSGYADYDYDHNVLLWYPDNTYVNNKITACTITTTPAMTCTAYSVTGAPTGTGSQLGAISNFRYNHDDGYFYFYPGNSSTTIYRIQGSALATGANWQSFPSAICTGADCPNGTGNAGGPPPRQGAGLACTSVDHACLLVGGLGITATAIATVSSGNVATAVVELSGSFYSSAPTVVVTPTGGDTPSVVATITATVSAGAVSGLTITNPGVGYVHVPTLSFTGGGQNNAANDMWAFSATANAGAGAWTEQYGPSLNPCTQGISCPTWGFANLKIGSRLVYDTTNNVFEMMDDISVMWTYAYSAATNGFGSSCVSGCYGIPTPASPITGPLNRTPPPAYPSISSAQAGAVDLSADVDAGSVYVSSVQPGLPGTSGDCMFLVPYFSIVGSGNALPSAGSQAVACSAVGSTASDQPSDHPFHTQISGTNYEVHSKRNWAGFSANAKTVIQAYSGGPSGTWTGGDVGCFTDTCFSHNSSWPQNSPRGIINANGTLALLTVENITVQNPTQDLFLATCPIPLSGLPCTSVTGNIPLNAYSSPTITFTNGNAVISGTNSFISQQIVYLNGNVPSPFVVDTPYFVLAAGLSSSQFELSLTGTGAAITPTANGTGIVILSYVMNAAFAADPSGNQLVCWSEEIDAPGRVVQTLPPQLHCKYWNGATMATVGTGANRGSLNQSLSSWARIEPGSVAYAGASGWFVGYTEQTRTGLPQAYVLNCPVNGTACSVVGGASLNRSGSDLAFEVSLSADGTTVYCQFGDQPAINSNTTALILKWNGVAWSTFQSGIVNDSVHGNVIDARIIVPSTNNVTSVWTEGSFGNTPQIFAANFTAISPPFLSVPITVSEALFPGDQTGHTDTANTGGLNRTNEPFCTGVPIADSVGLTVTTSLGLTGTFVTAGQFRATENWPDGNIKALKVCGSLSSYTASTPQTVTLTNSGSGNFGGPNLATDPGGASPIVVSTNGGTCGTGGAICFTAVKANFDGLDEVQIGSATLISSGASLGLTLIGPLPTATYPANVTVLPTSGGSAGATTYASKYDPASTCAVDQAGAENGPVMAVLKCSGSFLDSTSTYTYMHWTARLAFYLGRSNADVTVILRNADNGAANTFASAYKGYQSLELRLTTNDTGTATMNYAVNYNGTPGSNINYTGTLNHTVGTDYAYLYSAESNVMTGQSVNSGNYCITHTVTDGLPANICVPSSPLSGWTIVANGTAVESGSGTFGSGSVTGTTYAQGWMDIYDSNGAGVEIGQDEFMGYGNKSLEVRGGGTDVRVGLWAYENNTVSPSTVATQGTNNAPYYMPWPQWRIDKVLLDFHATPQTTAVASTAFLSRQHYLIGSPAYSYWNSTGVLFEPMLNPTQETAYYTSISGSNATPSVTNPVIKDAGMTDTYNWPLSAWKWYNWSLGGVGNQSEYHLSFLHNDIRRGLTGQYLDAASWYKMIAQTGFPIGDFSGGWQGQPASIVYWDQPLALENYTVANCTSSSTCLGNLNWVGAEHAHVYGMPEYYLATGDETIHDALLTGMLGWLAATPNTNPVFQGGDGANNRSLGVALMLLARTHNFLVSTGDTTDAATLLAQSNTLITNFIAPNLCAYAGYPSGCTPNPSGGGVGSGQVGVSRVRGLPFVSTSAANAGITQSMCPNFPAQIRATAPFMDGNLILGMYESLQEYGATWTKYALVNDLMYGISRFELSESFKDDGTNIWSSNTSANILYQPNLNSGPNFYATNGFIYKGAIDSANNCDAPNQSGNAALEYSIENPDSLWSIWLAKWLYEGQGQQTSAQRQLALSIQSAIYDTGSNLYTETNNNTMGMAINLVENANNLSLQTLPITSFTDNGGGSYTIGWITPSSTSFLRVKSGLLQIVDLIGFNPGTYTWIGNPAATQNWFASTDAPSIPAPVTGSQSMTITGLTTGLTSSNFMVKGMAPAPGGVASGNYVSGKGVFAGAGYIR